MTRHTLAARESLRLAAGDATLVFTLEGAAELVAHPRRACAGWGGRPDRPAPAHLDAGDSAFALGTTPLRVRAAAASVILVARLRPAPETSRLLAALPDVLTVGGFAAQEPGVAALAMHLGEPAAAQACAVGGGRAVCDLMATMLAVSTLRAWAVSGCAPADWAARTADPFLARVLDAIHADPGRDWSVESLAALGAMSRSVFAERFRDALGRSPAGYLAEVRMEAAKALLASGTRVSEASRRLGYESDEGFSRAFRRHTGMTPSAWRGAGLRSIAS
ncbi:helix-turn-helix transcriptional regulator [Microbacterium sp. NEAU-LLB]|uniref:Helix-turn-helix transcriptional regulator n=2 Tax=Microbacterium stercoris TaxID=2820289 RepID=A0A939QPY2_9MICO|nr:helix-turn-helix transcriptional regulator [Microbacterium stercoris]